MLTRVLAIVLAVALGGLAWMAATTTSTLDAVSETAATEHSHALLAAAETKWRTFMEADADRAAAFDFSSPLGGSLATIADPEEPDAAKAAARAALSTALGETARASSADILHLTDAAGTVLIRAEDATLAGDSIAGYPCVREALTGVITDDVWVLGSKIYHVVGIPVLDLGTVVGTVLWGRMLRADDLIAAVPSDVGAALFHLPEEGPALLHGATKSAGEAKAVSALLAGAATELATMRKERKPLGPSPEEVGGKSSAKLFVPLPGQAGIAHGAALLLLAEVAAVPAEGSIDFTDATVLGLFAGALLALVLALALPFVDAGSVRRAIAEAEAAADIRATRRATLPPPGPPDPRDAPPPPMPSSTFSPTPMGAVPTLQGVPSAPSASRTNPPMPAPILATSEPEESVRNTVIDQPAFMRGSAGHADVVTSAGKPNPLPRPPLPTVSPDEGAPSKPGAHRPTLPYPATASAGGAGPDPFAAKTLSYDAVAAREAGAGEPDEMIGDRTVVSSVSEVLARASAEEPSAIRKGGSAGRPTDDLHLGAKPPPPPGAAAPSGPLTPEELRDEEVHYREVYQQFMATKQRCGEPMDLTYERFLDRLHATKKSLIERYQCRTVRFSPYVKAGKAALKATPVK